MVKIWDPKDFKRSNLYRFLTYVNQKYELTLSDYASLHKWSVENLEDFWLAITLFFDFKFFSTPTKFFMPQFHSNTTHCFPIVSLAYINHCRRIAKSNS